jgi:hypothetical protein
MTAIATGVGGVVLGVAVGGRVAVGGGESGTVGVEVMVGLGEGVGLGSNVGGGVAVISRTMTTGMAVGGAGVVALAVDNPPTPSIDPTRMPTPANIAVLHRDHVCSMTTISDKVSRRLARAARHCSSWPTGSRASGRFPSAITSCFYGDTAFAMRPALALLAIRPGRF